ncbi:MAG: hypothetical protein KDE51_06440 [Anaerolineales bacterium]|nr:hypothetical protein [Anaerolineales bacterium]
MNNWEEQVAHWAKQFEYPPTPDLSRSWQASPQPKNAHTRPRLAWAMAVVVALLASLLLVPSVRATAVAIIRAGAVTIFVGEQPTPLVAPEGIQVPAELMTEISLAEALERQPDLRTLPDRGLPDQLFWSDVGQGGWSGDVIVQVWLAADGRSADIALYHISAPQQVYKGADWIDETTINGDQAFWINGPHLFRVEGVWSEWEFIDSNVLVWWTNNVTYRLESYLTFAEAVQAAESLVPLQEKFTNE